MQISESFFRTCHPASRAIYLTCSTNTPAPQRLPQLEGRKEAVFFSNTSNKTPRARSSRIPKRVHISQDTERPLWSRTMMTAEVHTVHSSVGAFYPPIQQPTSGPPIPTPKKKCHWALWSGMPLRQRCHYCP